MPNDKKSAEEWLRGQKCTHHVSEFCCLCLVSQKQQLIGLLAAYATQEREEAQRRMIDAVDRFPATATGILTKNMIQAILEVAAIPQQEEK